MLKKMFLVLLFFLYGCETSTSMKHPLDKSEVRKIILENGLRVYLLSDPNLNISAASVAVEVGSLDNPPEREGLAHFLEHMLFLGTKKYPDVDEYSSYLRSRGGYSNAYTASDLTNYQFQVLPDGFEGAIDRFSQFFISPLFTEEYTSREVNAVNSEHQKNIMNDFRRRYRISSLFAKKDHPEQKFSTGNLETLGDIKREELIDFYQKFYSANRMGLALLSTHSLDQLEKWARIYFSDIKNNKKEKNIYDQNFLEKKETFRLVHIEPIKDIRDLNIMFSLPGIRQSYNSKPGRQFGFILGHEGKGSLLSYLKDKGWAMSLSAGTGSQTNDYGYASITIGLTQEGLTNYKEVLKATMGYIQLMKDAGHQSHVFNELQTMASIDEIYSSKGEGMWRATQLANEVMRYPIEDAGRINYIYKDNTSKDYEGLLSHITPDNMLTMLTARGLKTDKKERFYQASYSYFEDDGFYDELLKAKVQSGCSIPDRNLFIPKRVSVPGRKIKENVFPQPIFIDGGTSLYFGQDHEFLRPKGVIDLKILFPEEKMSVNHRVYSRIYSACVNESLNELSYPAKQAGLNYSIREGYEGIYVNVNGYKESAMRLYELLLDHMTSFSITEKQFNAMKDRTVRDYENFSLTDAHQQTREMSPDILNELKYTWKDALPVARAATLESLMKYSETLYESTFLEAMVYGDFTEKDAKKVVRLFNEKTKTRHISRDNAFDINYLDFSEPETIQYTDEILVNNSCFFRQYVIGKDSPNTRAVSKIISKALEQPFYTEMRTNQQLGYIVWSYVRNMDETYYLNFLIQSGVYAADELNKRADVFIKQSPEILNELTDDEFQELIESSIDELEKKPMSISERANKLKTLIFDYGANYTRDKETIEALKGLNKENVANVLSELIDKKTRRMINVLTFAKNHENKSGVKTTFADLRKWKSSRTYK